MRLSTVFELLLIFLLIAFAAYGRVIDRDEVTLQRSIRSSEGQAKQEDLGVSVMSVEDAAQNLNKYCNCDSTVCNCCRNFSIPFVALGGPGCASLQYLKKDNLAVQVSFRDNILGSRVIDGKQPTPMCIPMPGGLSKICARVYSIEQEPDNHFKACLMLELQSASETEAAIRVRCFRFGPNGLEVRPGEALPVIEPTRKPSDDDDDDDDDFLDLDDDDDDDNNEVPAKNTASPSNNSQTEEDDDDDDDDDLLGFDALIDIFTGDDSEKKKKKTTTAAPISFTIPMIKPSTAAPHKDETVTSTKQPAKDEVTATTPTIPKKPEHTEPSSTVKSEDTSVTESSSEAHEETTIIDSSSGSEVTERIEAAASSDVKVTIKPKKSQLNRITVGVPYKKINGATSSINAIKNDEKKPTDRPNKPDPTHEPLHDEDDEDILTDDDDDKELEDLEADDEEEDDAGNQAEDDKEQDVDAEDEEELLNDEDDEEEAEVISALVSDDKQKVKVVDGGVASPKPEESDEDYAALSELLSRKRFQRRGRQSKVMRL